MGSTSPFITRWTRGKLEDTGGRHARVSHHIAGSEPQCNRPVPIVLWTTLLRQSPEDRFPLSESEGLTHCHKIVTGHLSDAAIAHGEVVVEELTTNQTLPAWIADAVKFC